MSFTVVASFASPVHAAAIGPLSEAGCTIRQIPSEARAWTPELVAEYAPTADAWLGTFPGLRLPRAVLERSERARVVVSSIIGTDFIDVGAASDLGILVAHGAMPENFEGMAEAGVMLIAALRKALPAKQAALAAGRWRPVEAGHMVKGASIGIIGFGRIGQGVARRLRGWDCPVLAYDPYLSAEVAASAGAEMVPLEDLLQRSDIVLTLVALSDETRHMIDKSAIAKMKPGACLINIGRGGCVDELALLAALDDGRLAGAAIDTWESEPVAADHPLLQHPKVIATGHVIGHSEELYGRIPGVASENLLRGLRGQEPLYIRNPEAMSAWRDRLARLAAV